MIDRQRSRNTRPEGSSGFTLIEVLVVIVILGILAAVVVFAVSGISDRGDDSACAIEERSIRTAVESYRSANNSPALPADVTDLVPGFLAEEPTHYYEFQNNGDGTFDVLPRAGSPC